MKSIYRTALDGSVSVAMLAVCRSPTERQKSIKQNFSEAGCSLGSMIRPPMAKRSKVRSERRHIDFRGGWPIRRGARAVRYSQNRFRNNRNTETPDENKAVVQASLALFGTYKVNKDGTMTLRIDRSSFPNWNGTDQSRTVTTLTDKELTWHNPAPSHRRNDGDRLATHQIRRPPLYGTSFRSSATSASNPDRYGVV